MVCMAMGDHHEVELGEVHALGLDVVGQDFGIVAGVEENPLAVDLDKRGKSPILLQRPVLAEGIVEDGDAIFAAAAVGWAAVVWAIGAQPLSSSASNGARMPDKPSHVRGFMLASSVLVVIKRAPACGRLPPLPGTFRPAGSASLGTSRRDQDTPKFPAVLKRQFLAGYHDLDHPAQQTRGLQIATIHQGDVAFHTGS